MQSIFSYEFHNDEPDEVLKRSISEYANLEKEEEYAKKTFEGVLKNQKDTFEKIKEFAPEWPIEKIAPVDRAILEVAVYEMLHSEDVPPIVAINEAIEMAKTFGDESAPKFVNGVLSAILKKYCTHRDHKTGKLVTIDV